MFEMGERMVLDRQAGPQGEMQLQTRRTPQGDLAYEIILNGVFLMASYNRASERALAQLALSADLPGFGEPGRSAELRVLVGGLGMGYTLQAALSCPDVAAVEMVENAEAVIGWNRRYFGDLNGHALDDPRVRLLHADLGDYLATATDPYHAICLDVDNGPGWLAQEENVRLYATPGLRRLHSLLVPGGVLTVWSAGPVPAFLARLRRVFGQAQAMRVTETDPWGHEVEPIIYRAHLR